MADALNEVAGTPLDADAWGRSPYQPTPTIVEAARALYSRHSVQAITRNDAGAKNLQVTSGTVEEIIERSRVQREKSIVFVPIGDTEFQLREVETGVSSEGWVQITRGLTAGEKVVTTGAFQLKSEARRESFGGHEH